MSPELAAPAQRAQVEFTIEGAQFRLTFGATVPTGPTHVSELLPLARALCDAVVGETIRALGDAGKQISCASGCGACCNNLVAISQVEARRIRDLVAALPEPRRSTVRACFADARQRFAAACLLEKLEAADQWTEAEYAALVGAYFAVGVPCPFLDDGACSIYAERPLTCREYLVTSPPQHCARVGSEGVRRVELPLRLFNALARWEVPPQGHFLERWVPLILAPEWADADPGDPPPKPGLELLQSLLAQVNA